MPEEENVRLRDYILSNGVLEPDDYFEYGATGPYQHLCVFCNHVHDNAHMLLFGGDEVTQTTDFPIEQVYACEDCGEVIDTFMPNKKRHDTILNNLEERATSSILKTYIETGLLPDDAISYSSGNYMADYCVFCNQQTENIGEIDIPVGSYPKILGPVLVCKNCIETLKKYQDNNPASYTRFNIKDTDQYSLLEWDRCISCKDQYEITKEEYQARAQQNTLKRHHCQSCQQDLWGMDRFMEIECSNCGKTAIYDLSLYKETLVPNDQFICANCSSPELFDYEHLCVIDEGKYMAQVYKKKCGGIDRFLIDFVSSPKDLNFDEQLKQFGSNEKSCPFDCNCHKSAYEAGFFAALKIREYKKNNGIS